MLLYERLYHEIEANNLMADHMHIWVGNEGACGDAKGFIIYNHIGIDNIREMLCEGTFKVYALRESDELDGDPATIENNEVMVNFFGYFITETDFDWCFKERDWQPLFSWDYDPD
jgi:hypothetical protein